MNLDSNIQSNRLWMDDQDPWDENEIFPIALAGLNPNHEGRGLVRSHPCETWWDYVVC